MEDVSEEDSVISLSYRYRNSIKVYLIFYILDDQRTSSDDTLVFIFYLYTFSNTLLNIKLIKVGFYDNKKFVFGGCKL